MNTCGLGCLLCSVHLSHENRLSVSRKSFKTFLPTLLKYLLIPEEHHETLRGLCTPEVFCNGCGQTIREVVELQVKAAQLELQIQMKVENMGNAVVTATSAFDVRSAKDIRRVWSQEAQDLWRKFRYPVIKNFAKGRLPSPSIQVKKCPLTTELAESSVRKMSKREKKIKIKTEPVFVAEEVNEDEEMPFKEEQIKIVRVTSLSQNIVESKSCTEETEGAKDPTGTMDCPVCDYKLPYGPLVNRSCEAARMSISHHFTRLHNPTESGDFVQDELTGQEFYACKFCEFAAYIKPSKIKQSYSDGKQRWYALLKHSRHLMKFHADELGYKSLKTQTKKKKKEESRTRLHNFPASPIKLNEEPNIQDGKFCFECPVADCDFLYTSHMVDDGMSACLSSKNKIRYGLLRIGDHVLKNHRNSDKELVDPYEAYVKGGKENKTIVCPWSKCGYVVPVADLVCKRSGSYKIFARHYGIHLYNNS